MIKLISSYTGVKREKLDWRIYLLLWTLAVPLLIFLLSWIKPLYGLPALLCLTLVLFSYKIEWNSVTPLNEIILAIFTVVLVVFSGNGEFSFQTYDHFKHNLIFADLVKYNWPVYYPATDEHLNYYLGYYLVPALFGKILGVQWVSWLNLFGLSFTFYLCLSYLQAFCFQRVQQFLLLFFFGGSAVFVVLYRVILAENVALNDLFDNVYLIWNGPWGRFPQIPIYESLKWVPQHLSSSFAFIIIWKESQRRSNFLIFNLLGLVLFWSVYVFIAGLLFLLFHLKFIRIKTIVFNIRFLAVLVPMFILGVYYLSHVSNATNSGNFQYDNVESYVYMISSILAFVLPLILIHYIMHGSFSKTIISAAGVYLIGSMTLAFSGDFDLFARGSMIFQLYVLIEVIHSFGLLNWEKVNLSNKIKILLIAVIFIVPGTISILGPQFYWKIKHGQWQGPKLNIETAYQKYESIREVFCAIHDADTSLSVDKCNGQQMTSKYSGMNCSVLRKRE